MSDEEQPCKKTKMTAELERKQSEANINNATCAHWVLRKKRFCKMTVAKGKSYCGEHDIAAVDTQDTAGDDRIPCPMDPKHTIYKKNLRKHLKICNAKPKTDEPDYIKKNVNLGEAEIEETDKMGDFKELRLNDLEDEEFYRVIQKVKDLHAKHVEGKIDSLSYHHACMDEELAKEEYGKESRKHLVQAAALLGILEKEETIKNSTSFVEYGAGKGQLAFYLANLLKDKENSQVILVDRMSLRHKKDNKIEDRSLVQRLRADIADFCLDNLPILKKSKHCIAVSKHLCGGATDLSLRCITQAKEQQTDLIMIAVCCHHRCDWRSFINKQFFRDCQINPREFCIITKMVSWAICGSGMSRERRKAIEEQNLTDEELLEINSNQRLSLKERESIGFMCKRVLDFARLEFLRRNSFEAQLHYYVPRDVTLENVVLLARRKNKE